MDKDENSGDGIKICPKTGKYSYDKKGAISAMNKRYKKDHIKLRCYPCKDHWHLTHKL